MVVWVEQVTSIKLKFPASDFALRYLAAAIAAFCCLVSRKASNIWLDGCCIQTLLHLTAMLRHSPEQPGVSKFANVILCI